MTCEEEKKERSKREKSKRIEGEQKQKKRGREGGWQEFVSCGMKVKGNEKES